jgi:hypothetical protein
MHTVCSVCLILYGVITDRNVVLQSWCSVTTITVHTGTMHPHSLLHQNMFQIMRSTFFFIIIHSTQIWYKHNMNLQVLHISACCSHLQVHRAFTVIVLFVCCASLYWPVFTHGFIVQVYHLCNALML